jgi:hypothetical protein
VTEKLNNHQVILLAVEITKEGIYPSIEEGPAAGPFGCGVPSPSCWPAASAMNFFIPHESATLSLNLQIFYFSVSSCAHITRHLGSQEYASSRKDILSIITNIDVVVAIV